MSVLALRLIVKPNIDDIGWTRFEGSAGGAPLTMTLEELPKRLHLPVTPLIRKMLCDRMFQLVIDWPAYAPILPTAVDPSTLVDATDMLTNAKPWLQHIAWWLEYTRRRRVCVDRASRAAKNAVIQWHCLECESPLSSKRETCTDNRCASQHILSTITGARATRPAKQA